MLKFKLFDNKNTKYGIFNGSEDNFENWKSKELKVYNKVDGFSQDAYKGFKDAFKS